MTAFAIIDITLLPAPAGTLQRARLYAPDGSTVSDLALVESPAGLFSGTVAVTIAASGLHEYEVRQVLTQSAGGFDASSTITVSRGDYGYLGADPVEAEPSLPCYLLLADADAIAAALPGLTAYTGATDAARLAALVQATADVDALRYQGRQYDPAQVLQFPRVAYSTRAGTWPGASVMPAIPLQPGDSYAGGDVVWDYDTATNAAIVPPAVKRAVVLQAASVLAGTRSGRLDAVHDGLTSQSVDGMSESYAAGRPSPVCRAAMQLLDQYRLRQGRLL